MIDIGITLSSPATILTRYALLEHLHRMVLSLFGISPIGIQSLGISRFSTFKNSASHRHLWHQIDMPINLRFEGWDLSPNVIGGLGGNRHCSLKRYSWGQKHCLGPFCKMFRFQVFFFFLSHDSKFCWHLTFLGQLSSFTSIRWICGLSSFGFVTCGFVGFVRERGRRGGVGVGACSFNSSFPCFSVRAGPPIREGWDSQLGNYISQFTLARDFLIGTYSRSKKELMHLNAHTEICHSTFWNQSENMVTMSWTWSHLILQSERRLFSCWTESTQARSTWRPCLPPRAPPSAPSLSR